MHSRVKPRLHTNLTVQFLSFLVYCTCITTVNAADILPDKSKPSLPAKPDSKSTVTAAAPGVNLKMDLAIARLTTNGEECEDETGDLKVNAAPLGAPTSPTASLGKVEAGRKPGSAPSARTTPSAGADMARATPAPAPLNLSTPSGTWEIFPTDKTLNAALARWAAAAGWQLVWELPVDYAVETRTSVPGTFEEAVGMVAKSMESAEIPMKAIFYAGNKVLRIVAKGVE